MEVKDFLNSLSSERKDLLTKINKIILTEDKSVKAEIGKMMGKEMIIYKCPGSFKYGLAGNKDYMSLHCLPIYGSEILHKKYSQMLSKAKIQKGCINFKSEDEIPLNIIKELIQDCSKIDLIKLRQEQLESRKKAK